MTIRSRTTLGPLVHEVEWAPAETIISLWGGIFKLLAAPVVRLGAADRIDQEQGKQHPFGGFGLPRGSRR